LLASNSKLKIEFTTVRAPVMRNVVILRVGHYSLSKYFAPVFCFFLGWQELPFSSLFCGVLFPTSRICTSAIFQFRFPALVAHLVFAAFPKLSRCSCRFQKAHLSVCLGLRGISNKLQASVFLASIKKVALFSSFAPV
jgi:hypothetical protein